MFRGRLPCSASKINALPPEKAVKAPTTFQEKYVAGSAATTSTDMLAFAQLIKVLDSSGTQGYVDVCFMLGRNFYVWL